MQDVRQTLREMRGAAEATRGRVLRSKMAVQLSDCLLERLNGVIPQAMTALNDDLMLLGIRLLRSEPFSSSST
jgi:hypothetical protein